MKILIRKREYARGLMPWCPYMGGFFGNLFNGRMTAFCWLGYRVDIASGRIIDALRKGEIVHSRVI